jgi:alanyl-tRNA synthetase
VVALGAKQEGKAFVIVKVSDDLTNRLHAGQLVQVAAKLLKGSGGGRAEMAQAGGPEVGQLSAALQEIENHIKNG